MMCLHKGMDLLPVVPAAAADDKKGDGDDATDDASKGAIRRMKKAEAAKKPQRRRHDNHLAEVVLPLRKSRSDLKDQGDDVCSLNGSLSLSLSLSRLWLLSPIYSVSSRLMPDC